MLRNVVSVFDALGKTGRICLRSFIFAAIRSQNGVTLATASSGIADTLEGDRAIHSAFKLKLKLITFREILQMAKV